MVVKFFVGLVGGTQLARSSDSINAVFRSSVFQLTDYLTQLAIGRSLAKTFGHFTELTKNQTKTNPRRTLEA